MKNRKIKIYVISQELFQFSLITYLILFIFEVFKEGFVSNFFNINILLVIVLASGMGMVLAHGTDNSFYSSHEGWKISRKGIFDNLLLALCGALLVYFGTNELGILAIARASLTAFIILFLTILIRLE